MTEEKKLKKIIIEVVKDKRKAKQLYNKIVEFLKEDGVYDFLEEDEREVLFRYIEAKNLY